MCLHRSEIHHGHCCQYFDPKDWDGVPGVEKRHPLQFLSFDHYWLSAQLISFSCHSPHSTDFSLLSQRWDVSRMKKTCFFYIGEDSLPKAGSGGMLERACNWDLWGLKRDWRWKEETGKIRTLFWTCLPIQKVTGTWSWAMWGIRQKSSHPALYCSGNLSKPSYSDFAFLFLIPVS